MAQHEVTAIGKPSTADPFAYQLEDAPDTVVLGAGDRFHLS